MVYDINYSNPNPKLSANILSKFTFSWLIPLFWYGRKNDLEAKDIYDVLPENESGHVDKMLDRSWHEEVEAAKKSRGNPSLLKAVIKTFFWPIVCYTLVFSVENTAISLLQPMIIEFHVKYFNTEASIWYGIGSATLVVLAYFTTAFVTIHSQFKLQEVGMRAKIACSSLIYRKMTRLSYTAMAQIDEGHIINLLSNDVIKWEQFFMLGPYVLIAPMQLIGIIYIMVGKVETTSFVGILAVILQILPIQAGFYWIVYKFRLKAAMVADRRILLIKEIFRGIKVVKMYNWEKAIENIVLSLRRREIKWLKWIGYTKGISLSISTFAARAALFTTILTYFVIEGKLMSSENIFSSWRYFIILQLTSFHLVRAVAIISETKVAVARVEKFLLLEEIKYTNQYYPKDDTNKSTVCIQGVSVSWGAESITNILSDINIKMYDKHLYLVVGPAGAGKSSLLKLILGELQPNAGSVSIRGKVSYSSQTPLLFSCSVKNNILFGEPYDEIRYKKVTNACALTEDFNQLSYGDKTLVGDGGSALSGGQRARINLARALYRKADIYLLDDCLSSVDISVGKEIYHKCFKVFLKEQTCILVTHNLQYTADKDNIIMIDQGTIKYNGTFENLKKDDVNSRYMDEYINGTEDFETTHKNKIHATEKKSEEYMTINFESKEDKEPSETDQLMVEAYEPREAEELIVKGKLGTILYWKFFKSGGSYWKLFVIAFTTLLYQVFICLTDLWISHLSKINTTNFRIFTNESEATSAKSFFVINNDQISTALYIFGFLISSGIIIILVRSLMFFDVCMKACENIHNTMLIRLLRAPLSFFYVNNIGRIINRFSQDTGTVDNQLAEFLLNAIQTVVFLFALLLLICLTKWWIIFPTILVIFVCIKMQHIYQTTARDVRRLEGIAKGPVFSHVNSSFTGLLTIRSCQLQESVCEEFTHLQNHHTSAYYLVLAGMTISYFWTAFMANLLITIISYGSLFTNNSPSTINFIHTQIYFLLVIIQFIIKWFTEILVQMVNLERMFQFTEVNQESSSKNHSVKSFNYWPTSGRIQVDHLYLKYFDSTRSVLKNINFSIEAGQKIGIVGRTGAGKSTLIAALFRLVDFDGSIYIDDVDIKKRDIYDVRSSISIIPQDNLLFTLSLRENLDPNKDYSDQTIWSVLKDVGLDHVYTSLNVLLDKNELSMGQIQLLSLARAILKKTKIVVLDEATANVDDEMNITVQSIIKNKLKDCTLISVAHRLNTVIDSDKVLVMDDGQILEFDHPYVLLQKEGGAFQRMALQSNDAAYESLKQIAKDDWIRKKKCS